MLKQNRGERVFKCLEDKKQKYFKYQKQKKSISKLISEGKNLTSVILNDYGIDKISTEEGILLISSKNGKIISPEGIFFESINSFTDTPRLISQKKDGNFVLLSAITGKFILGENEFYKEIKYSYGGIFCKSNNGNAKLLDNYGKELLFYDANSNTILFDENSNFFKKGLFDILQLLDKELEIINDNERKILNYNGDSIEL